jgi:nucleotide-binding universal stress UspA family protein
MAPIMVGVDGSRSAERALRWAVGAFGTLGGELLLVSVAPPDVDGRQIEEQLLAEWSGPVQERCCPFRTMVVSGVPGPALAAVASEVGPRLVVVGAGHERWYPALHLGSASHYLAQRVDRPLCIVPLDTEGFAADQVVVGVDGSAGSDAAMRWAATIASYCGGKVTAAHGWQRSATRMTNVAVGVNDQDAAVRACRDWVAPLEDAGVLADVLAAEGAPCQVLARALAETGANLLVLGGRRSPGRLGIAPLCALQAALAPTVLVPAAA